MCSTVVQPLASTAILLPHYELCFLPPRFDEVRFGLFFVCGNEFLRDLLRNAGFLSKCRIVRCSFHKAMLFEQISMAWLEPPNVSIVTSAQAAELPNGAAHNIVLVHGAFVDQTSWKPVADNQLAASQSPSIYR